MTAPTETSPTTKQAWLDVTSFADLSHTMVRFLEGELLSSPNHYWGLDPESSPIVADLVALTRRGLVTHGSQPALSTPESRQRACVDLLTADADTALRLVVALGHTELVVLAAPDELTIMQDLPMTWWANKFTTWAGRLGGGERAFWHAACGPAAYYALAKMCFVQVLDPQWGRERYLWEQLSSAVDALDLPYL